MDAYTNLAKSAVENYIKKGKTVNLPNDLSEELLARKAGVFVTIEKDRSLRGCIGTYLPTKNNIAEEIISNAIAAATKDYRFEPIQKEELPHFSYTVYILSGPKKVSSIENLNPKKYGVIVKSGLKAGLLLPDLEGIDTTEKQISIACQKAGIDIEKEQIEIWRFEAEKHQ